MINMLNLRSTGLIALHIAVISAMFVACNSNYSPRPTGYYKINFPQRSYQRFDNPEFPFSFEYPAYANIVRDTTYFQEKTENPYWLNIDFPRFNGKIYISYNIIGGKTVFKIKRKDGYADSIGVNTFEGLVKSSYDLTFKHSYKASSIDDSVFRTANGIEGIYFRLGGNTATANQFLLTDSVKNFLRGALYFDATPNEDSLGIVNDFLQQDLKHLINTFKWN